MKKISFALLAATTLFGVCITGCGKKQQLEAPVTKKTPGEAMEDGHGLSMITMS